MQFAHDGILFVFTVLCTITETRSIWKMLGPFATTSRLTPIHQVSPLYCRTPPAHRCPQRRQRVTEGTAMAPWNGPNKLYIHMRNSTSGHSLSLEALQIQKRCRPRFSQISASFTTSHYSPKNSEWCCVGHYNVAKKRLVSRRLKLYIRNDIRCQWRRLRGLNPIYCCIRSEMHPSCHARCGRIFYRRKGVGKYYLR